eukprot:9242122-Prorocentrum_lima.AAC.1
MHSEANLVRRSRGRARTAAAASLPDLPRKSPRGHSLIAEGAASRPVGRGNTLERSGDTTSRPIPSKG